MCVADSPPPAPVLRASRSRRPQHRVQELRPAAPVQALLEEACEAVRWPAGVLVHAHRARRAPAAPTACATAARTAADPTCVLAVSAPGALRGGGVHDGSPRRVLHAADGRAAHGDGAPTAWSGRVHCGRPAHRRASVLAVRWEGQYELLSARPDYVRGVRRDWADVLTGCAGCCIADLCILLIVRVLPCIFFCVIKLCGPF